MFGKNVIKKTLRTPLIYIFISSIKHVMTHNKGMKMY